MGALDPCVLEALTEIVRNITLPVGGLTETTTPVSESRIKSGFEVRPGAHPPISRPVAEVHEFPTPSLQLEQPTLLKAG